MELEKVNRSEVSRYTRTDVAHISRIFNKKSYPSLRLAKQIAECLGCSLEDLCEALEIDSKTPTH